MRILLVDWKLSVLERFDCISTNLSYLWTKSYISCHIKLNADVANRYILDFTYLAQIKSEALLDIEVNTFSQN